MDETNVGIWLEHADGRMTPFNSRVLARVEEKQKNFVRNFWVMHGARKLPKVSEPIDVTHPFERDFACADEECE